MRFRIMLVLCTAAALAVGVSTATAGGGNSDAAHACQQGGWQELVREDGTPFKNTGDCVSYAAHGGKLKSACVAGSDNFSGDAEFSNPTTFAGGTIDTAYGPDGNIRIEGSSWAGFFAAGTHLVFTGFDVGTFHLTFTHAVNSVQLQAQSNFYVGTNVTLMAFDASNNPIGSDSQSSNFAAPTLTVGSATNNIKSFTIATDDPGDGLGFSNIVWGCA